MDSMYAAKRGALVRDLLIFQFKLLLDAAKDLVLIKLSILAVIVDLLFGKPGRPMLFYRLLRVFERFDLWLNLHGAASRADDTDDGLFGASRAGSNTLLGKLEELVRNRVEGPGERMRTVP